MPFALQLDASDIRPLAVEAGELPAQVLLDTREDAAEQGGPWFTARLRTLEGEGRVERLSRAQRVFVPLSGSAHVTGIDSSVTTALRPGEPARFSGAEGLRLSGSSRLLEFGYETPCAEPSVTLWRLGRRTVREALPPGAAFVHAAGGALSIRVTDEEDPFHLESGESLWLDELEGDEELELRGQDAELRVVLLQRPD